MEREKLFREYLEGKLKGKSVCDFSRNIDLVFLELPAGDELIHEKLEAFYKLRGISQRAVLVTSIPVDGATHREAVKLVSDTFHGLYYKMAKLELGSDELAKQRLSQSYRFAKEVDGYPVFIFRDDTMNTIALSPHHEPLHPRWGPFLCLVSTWTRDVVIAQERHKRAVDNIRIKTLTRAGRLYEFDCVYLLPPGYKL